MYMSTSKCPSMFYVVLGSSKKIDVYLSLNGGNIK